MKKKLLSLLLTLALLLYAAPGLGEPLSSLSAARISALQKLAGENGAQWSEGTPPSPDMNAFQLWQWTDWFLSSTVRSLLGAIQDYEQLSPGNALDAAAQADQWQLREMENTLSCFEAQLEEDRLAILNGISLYQRSETSQAERQAAISRILEAESELRQIIDTICRDYQTYVALADACSNRLQSTYGGYTQAVHDQASAGLAASAKALEGSENAGNADIHVSVSSTSQFHIRLLNPNKQPISGATVTLANPLNQSQVQATTDSQGDAAFWVSDLGADETGELQLSLRVEAKGYRTRETQTVRLRSGETRTVELQKDNGEPYLIMGCFNGRDILTETNTYYSTAANTAKHAFTVKLHCDQSGTLVLRYPVDAKATRYQTVTKSFSASDSDSTVLVFEDQWLRKLVPGTRVSFTIKTGEEQYTTDTLLVIQKALVEAPVLSKSALFTFAGRSNVWDFSIPDDIPFIGGSNLSIDIPDTLPQTVYLPSNRAMYALGYDFKPEQALWQTRDAEDEVRAVKAFEVKGKADEALALAGAYRDINTTTQSSLLGEQSAYVTPFASLQGLYRANDSTLELSGSAGATMASQSDLSQTYSMGPAPFIVGMNLDMGAGFGLDATSTAQLDVTDGVPTVVGNPKTGYGNGSTVSLSMDMRTTSGMGVRDDVTVDVSGYGSLNPTVDFTQSGVNAAATLDMGMYATVRDLFLRWKSTLWEGKLGLSQRPATVPGVPMAEAYLHLDNTGSMSPFPSSSGSSYGTSGVEPTETKQLLSPVDSAAGDIQYVVIGGDTYVFWIQPGADHRDKAQLFWYNLTNSRNGQVSHLSNNSIKNPNSSVGGEGGKIMRKEYADYDFAVDISRGENNQTSSFCALTILSGNFSSAGSGTSSQTPTESLMTTVLMERNERGELEIRFYEEDAWKIFQQDDYAVMPEVYLTSEGDDIHSVRIASTCSSSGNPKEIHAMAYYQKDGSAKPTLDEVVFLEPFTDGDGINRYQVGTPSSANHANVYSLNEAGELSRMTRSQRALLAQGNIINFRVYSQLDTGSDKDRLFYLERVELEKGKYTHRLKCVTLDRTNSAAAPVITDYDVEISADQFDIVRFGSGVYLYWTECSAPTDAAGQGIQEAYLVRCVRYDPGTDTVSGPFSLVELSERPNSIKLLDDGTGYYTVDLESSKGSYVRQSLSRFTYKLVSAAELTAAAPINPCVRAGESAQIVFSVKNTGNVPLSGFDVKLCNGSQVLQTLHIDCTNPENNSNTMGTSVMKGAYAVSRISSMYDPLSHDSWDIVQTQAGRAATSRSVQTNMLMPGDTHSYTARLLVPADWDGKKSLFAAIDSAEGTAALHGEMKDGTLMLTGANAGAVPKNLISRPGTAAQTLNTDAHDLSLSAQLFKRAARTMCTSAS